MKLVKLNHQDLVTHKLMRLFVSGFGQDAAVLQQILRSDDLEKETCPDVYLTAEYADNISKDIDALGPRCSIFEQDLLDTSELEAVVAKYEKVEIIGWSFGVRMARALADKVPHLSEKISFAVALNGTIFSVDNNYGITEKNFNPTYRRFSSPVYDAFIENTLISTEDELVQANVNFAVDNNYGITEKNFNPTYRRFSSPVYDAFIENTLISTEDELVQANVNFAEDTSTYSEFDDLKHSLACRDMAILKSELRFMPYIKLSEAWDSTLLSLEKSAATPPLVYNAAIISTEDSIIMPRNQQAYWTMYQGNGLDIYKVKAPHFCAMLISKPIGPCTKATALIFTRLKLRTFAPCS